MKPALIAWLFAAAVGSATAARAGSYTITAELWMQPRSGSVILQMPPVQAAVSDWMRHPGSHLVILHSGDDQGSLWASEVQDWLVSLGIPSTDIRKRVSGQDENSVTLLVER
ncbi:MAG TPA: hypothetical protein VNI53_08770 [Gammaproteobacteria bacterium]|nr:hypothetical protein [Gammaproteobacteria bacterium]